MTVTWSAYGTDHLAEIIDEFLTLVEAGVPMSATTRQNSAFLKAATEAIPDLERFHTAIDAAEAKKEAQ